MGFELHETSKELKRQTFNRIKSIRAEGGFIVVDVKEDHDADYIGPEVTEQVWSVREAAERAQALNAIANKLPDKEKLVALDIVHEVITRCREAQQQLQDPKVASKSVRINKEPLKFDKDGKVEGFTDMDESEHAKFAKIVEAAQAADAKQKNAEKLAADMKADTGKKVDKKTAKKKKKKK